MIRFKLPKRLFYFSSIGAFAALVHVFIVFNLVYYCSLLPLVANIFGFLVAFNVSYFGHRYLTFSQLHNQKKLSLPHFFIVASSASIINELLYFLLLHYTRLNYLISLVFVLGFMAVYSFLFARYWACR